MLIAKSSSLSRDGDSTVEKMKLRMAICPSCKYQTVLEDFCCTSTEKLSTSISGGGSSDEKENFLSSEREIESLREQLAIVSNCQVHITKRLDRLLKEKPRYNVVSKQIYATASVAPWDMIEEEVPGNFDADTILESFKNVSKIKLESSCLMNAAANTPGETERLLKKYKESLKATYFIEFNQELRLMFVYSNISKQIDLGEVEWDFCWTRSFRSMAGVKLGRANTLYVWFRDTKGWLVVQAKNIAEAMSLRNVIKATIEKEDKDKKVSKHAIKFMVSVQKQGKVRLTNRLVVCSGQELRFYHKPGHFLSGGKPSQVIHLKQYESPDALETKFVNFHARRNLSNNAEENRELKIKCRSVIQRDELLNLITIVTEEEDKKYLSAKKSLNSLSLANRTSLVNLSLGPKKRRRIVNGFVVDVAKAPIFTLAATSHKSALDGLASGKTSKKKKIFKEEELKLPDEKFLVPLNLTNKIFWFMRKIHESIHRGSFLSPDLHICSSVWTMRDVPIRHYEVKLEMFEEVTREVLEAFDELGKLGTRKIGSPHEDVLRKLQNKLGEHREKLAQSLPAMNSDETSALKEKSMAAKFWKKVARKIDVDTKEYVAVIEKFCRLGDSFENHYKMFQLKGHSCSSILIILEALISTQVKFFVSVLVTDTMEFLYVYLNQCQHDLVMN